MTRATELGESKASDNGDNDRCYKHYFSSFLLILHVLALCLSFYLSKHKFTCRSTRVTKHMSNMCLPHSKHTFSSCLTHV
jgi:hypothetical protein